MMHEPNSMRKIRLKFAPKQFKRGAGARGRDRLVARVQALAVACRRFAKKAETTEDAAWADTLAEALGRHATPEARRVLVSADEAERVTTQHAHPCGDCPWRQDSLPGWTGERTAAEWVASAHGEDRVECHTKLGAQCVGVANYRANVCKVPRDPASLRGRRDPRVFGSPKDFLVHHDDHD